ncbi:hypothetical protein [Streptomyces tricolor]
MTSTPPLDLDAIRDRLDAATEGPWQRSEDYSDILTPEGDHLASYFKAADGELIAHAPEDIARLLAEVRRLRAELAAERERYTAGLRRADEHVNAMTEEMKRYADGEEQPVLWSVYNAMHLRADNAEARAAELERQAAAPRTLTEAEHGRAWHAIEGAAGEEGADPGTVLNAVLAALGINPPPASA